MTVSRIEILVEEPSMEAALNHLLPSLLGQMEYEIFPFLSKEDLLSKLSSRLRAYARFLPATTRILVLVDRDGQNCESLKKRLEVAATGAGLVTRSSTADGIYNVANRIVIEELEAWYFGDWQAVRRAYPKIDARWPRKAGFRNADAVAGGTWEAFERIAQSAGYFKGGLRKVEAANKIAPLMDPQRNTSKSFQVLRAALREMVEEV